MRSAYVLRIRFIALAFLLVSLVFLVRLYFVQVVNGSDYRREAEAQYVAQSENRLDRGSIFFTARDGSRISAATLAYGYTLAVDPTRITDPEAAFEGLTSFLPGLDRESFLTKAAKKGDSYEEIQTRVPGEVGDAIEGARIPGVELFRETWRFYPGGELAAHVIGFLGYGENGTVKSGQYGLERFYDKALTKDKSGLYVNFFADLFTNIRSTLSAGEAAPGADIATSIEPSVESHLEMTLARYAEHWHPETVGGIIMDPKTGAVVAMAARPTFDLNDYGAASISSFGNPLVENVYEFGSIMKPLTVAAALDAGAITPALTYNDRGSVVLDGKKISNFDGKARGVVSMQEILNQSLNVGIAFIVQRMGSDTLKRYFEKYGITEATGMDLPNEAAPLISNFESPRTVEYVTAGFGQGIALTPIAMTRALAVIANGGRVPSPHVALGLEYGGGLTRAIPTDPPREAITPETADTVTRMLVTVVDTALKGGAAKIPEYSVAAKTGTAQIARPDARGYYDDRYLHSFFGYFPAYDPKFIVFFFAVAPQGAKYASETWTDPFMETVKFLVTYYDIPPDRAMPLTEVP